MKLRTILYCLLSGALWLLFAADARCAVSDADAPSPVTGELTRQVPLRVADAYDLKMLLAQLNLEAGDPVAFDRTVQDLGHEVSPRNGWAGRLEQDASDAVSAAERRAPDGGDLVFRLRKIRI